MKLQEIIKMTALLLLCASCSEMSDMQQTNVDKDAPLSMTVSGGTAPTMRAASNLYQASTGFDGTEQVKVYMLKGSITASAIYDVGTPYNSGTLKMSDLTLHSGEDAIYYPTGPSGSVNLYGVYPSTSTAAHTVAYDQTGDDAYKTSDLMYAKVPVSWTTLAEKYALKPNLAFGHQLVKLKVNVLKYEDVWHVQGVKLHNVKRSVGVTDLDESAMTLGTATSATDGNGDEILIAGEETASTTPEFKQYSYACVFPAQEWNDGDGNAIDFLTVTADGGESVYQLKKQFFGGYEYTLNINLNSLALGNTVTITDWTDATDCVVNPTTASGGTLKIAAIDDQNYTGSPIILTPAPAVTYTDKTTGVVTELTEGTHYTLKYFNNTNAGQAVILALGETGTDYEGQIGLGSFNIRQVDLAQATIADISDQTYKRSACTPEPLVTSGGRTLTKDVDYTITYQNNVNAASASDDDAPTFIITAVPEGNYSGTNSKKFTIQPKSLTSSASDFNITLSATSKEYNGSTQSVTVSSVTDTNSGNTETMALTTDYTVSGATTSTSANVGTYTVTITGTGNYTGSKTATWQITKAPASVTTAPTAKTGLKSGTDNALVNAGTASDGTMYYYKTTTATTPSTSASGWSTSVPTASDAGTYYVYYYVKGDSNHTDTSVSGPVTVTVAAGTQKGTIITDPTNSNYIKVYTDATHGYKISKSNTQTSVTWSNNSSWGSKAQWQEIFKACDGTDSSGYNVLNSAVSAAGITGWTAMSGNYWSCTESSSFYAWIFYGSGWNDNRKIYKDNVRTVSAFTD